MRLLCFLLISLQVYCANFIGCFALCFVVINLRITCLIVEKNLSNSHSSLSVLLSQAEREREREIILICEVRFYLSVCASSLACVLRLYQRELR
jgi:hypothetical protein